MRLMVVYVYTYIGKENLFIGRIQGTYMAFYIAYVNKQE